MKIAYKLSSNEREHCPFCRNFTLDGIEKWTEAAKHLQSVHELLCMHVGEESSWGDRSVEQHTVAVFGSEDPPAELPLPKLTIQVQDVYGKELKLGGTPQE